MKRQEMRGSVMIVKCRFYRVSHVFVLRLFFIIVGVGFEYAHAMEKSQGKITYYTIDMSDETQVKSPSEGSPSLDLFYSSIVSGNEQPVVSESKLLEGSPSLDSFYSLGVYGTEQPVVIVPGLNEESSEYAYSKRFNEILNRLGLIAVDDEAYLPEKQELMGELHAIGDSFVHNAMKYGRIIIEERSLPDAMKTIKQARVGGIAGGEKYTAQGILFKFAQDKKLGQEWLYGGQTRNDYLAGKAAGQELLSANCVGSCLSEVRVPLMAIIDYWGHRLIATAMLPITGQSLLYGSADGGVTMLASDSKVNILMEEIGRKLNLKKHGVGSIPMSLCGDIEVHACHFKGQGITYYCLDTARAFPPEAPGARSEGRSIFYEKLRPEFLRKYTEPLSSDGFTAFQRSGAEARSLNGAIRQATQMLLGNNVRKYVKKLLNEETIEKILLTTNPYYSLSRPSTEKTSDSLIDHMHANGFNLRHLGSIYSALDTIEFENTVSTSSVELIKRYIINVMITRVVKNFARANVREGATESKQQKEKLVEILNKIFCNDSKAQRSAFWNTILPSLLQKKFGITVQDLVAVRKKGFLLLTLCQLLGILIHSVTFTEMLELYDVDSDDDLNYYDYGGANDYREKFNFEFTEADIADVRPTLKYLNFIDLATGISYLIQGSKYNSRGSRMPAVNFARMGRDKLQAAFVSWSDTEHPFIPHCLKKLLGTIDEVILQDAYNAENDEENEQSGLSSEKDASESTTIFTFGPSKNATKERGKDVGTALVKDLKNPQLAKAVARGDKKGIARLFQKGAHVNETDVDGNPVLFLAAKKRRKEIVQLLLEKGADIHARDESRKTVLHWAAEKGYRAIVELLFLKGAYGNAEDVEGLTALHLAVENDHYKIIANILKKNEVCFGLWSVDIHAKDADGVTVLQVAAGNGNREIVELLLENGLDINDQDYEGRTALHYAAYEEHKGIVKLLLGKGADVIKDYVGRTALWDAVWNNNEEIVDILIDKGADINLKDRQGQILLTKAACEDNIETVALLLKKGADINGTDNLGQTALIEVALYGEKEIVKFLVERGADIHLKDNQGNRALHMAARANKIENAEFLLSKGAEINAGNNNGKTALMVGGDKIAAFLVSTCDINARDNDGKTALHWAVTRRGKGTVECLLSNGADMSARDVNGNTALHEAAAWGGKEIVEFLLSKKAKVSAKNINGETALHTCVAAGYAHEVVGILLTYGARVDDQTILGRTPLHMAVTGEGDMHGNRHMVEILLKNGASIDAKDNEGKTALHLAAGESHQLAVKLLLSHGANINARDNDGKTAIDVVAARNDQQEITRFLLSKGAKITKRNNKGQATYDSEQRSTHKKRKPRRIRGATHY